MTPQADANLSKITVETSALVQHFLLLQGAKYASRASEADWKRVPVLLQVPPDNAGALPPGAWLILPWEAPSIDQFHAWLQRLPELPVKPRVLVLVMAAPVLRTAVLATLAAEFSLEIVGISSVDQAAYGARIAERLQAMFEPETLAQLQKVNPLEHLQGLGDSRNPDVFFDRLRHTERGTPVTQVLIALNALVFLVMIAPAVTLFQQALAAQPEVASLGHGQSPDLLTAFFAFVQNGFPVPVLKQFGANVAALTSGQHQAWRLLVCTFIHANLLHIAMNMWVLRSLGQTAERFFGRVAFASVYLLAGIGGSIASLAFTLRASPNMPSVGASGAVFGLMGGLLGFALSRRHAVPREVFRGLVRSAVTFTALNLALGSAVASIDNGAHIGGLITGFLAGLLLSRDLPPAPQPPLWRRLTVIACMIALLAVCFYLVSNRMLA